MYICISTHRFICYVCVYIFFYVLGLSIPSLFAAIYAFVLLLRCEWMYMHMYITYMSHMAVLMFEFICAFVLLVILV